ncbi:MAG: NRDE family protein [Pseudomonadales bacterium]
MCLILFAVQPNQKLRLVVAANRDEFYGRPASRVSYWNDYPDILAGRDLQAGGTWLGISKSGRFAAVTNFREDPPEPIPPRSRGELTRDFLRSDCSPETYIGSIKGHADEYRGFNLVLDDGKDTYYYSNRATGLTKLEPGFYGLSNQMLDCDWPKVNRGREALSVLTEQSPDMETLHQGLFGLLGDKGDGSPFSNSFIATAEYGTCAASVLTMSSSGEICFQEQGFLKNGEPEELVSYHLGD